MRTIHASLQEAEDTIGKVDARVLVCDVLGVDRAYLATHPMHVLTETQDARIDMLVAQRAIGHPVAHLLEQREFYGREAAGLWGTATVPHSTTYDAGRGSARRRRTISPPARASGESELKRGKRKRGVMTVIGRELRRR